VVKVRTPEGVWRGFKDFGFFSSPLGAASEGLHEAR
jgi:hypothetical protein